MIGVVSREEALAKAREKELDLVEVSPLANPPVCKIINFGAFVYRQEKAERKQKKNSKRVDIKGIRISLKMGPHDWDNRLKQSRKFLDQGDKVKVELIMRGREQAHHALAREKMEGFVAALGNDLRVESPIGRTGNRLNILVAKA